MLFKPAFISSVVLKQELVYFYGLSWSFGLKVNTAGLAHFRISASRTV